MDAATEFDLAGEIERLYEETKIADPGEFAERLLPRIPAQVAREIVRAHLREIVRQWLGAARTGRRRGTGKKPKYRRSRKMDVAAALLIERYPIGRGRWARLGDCGRAEIGVIIAEHNRNASTNAAKAVWFTHLSETLLRRRVEKVRDLDHETLLALVKERP